MINLGACTPDDVIAEACLRTRPDAVIVSTVNGHGHIDGARLIEKLRRIPDLGDMRIVIGGKLGTRGAENRRHIDEMVALGYDAAFEDSDIGRFEQFLRAMPGIPLLQEQGAA